MFCPRLEKGATVPFSDATFGQELGCCALAEVAAMGTKSKCATSCSFSRPLRVSIILDRVCVCRHVMWLLATATRYQPPATTLHQPKPTPPLSRPFRLPLWLIPPHFVRGAFPFGFEALPGQNARVAVVISPSPSLARIFISVAPFECGC